MKFSSGQVLLLTLVVTPLLLLLLGLLLRGGLTMVIHDQVQNHCDKKVLDALKIEADGLSLLGKINPVARWVIRIRRVIDKAVMVAAIMPPLLATLFNIQRFLNGLQKIIDGTQKLIQFNTNLQTTLFLAHRPPLAFGSRIYETWTPAFYPFLKLHIEKEKGFEKEVGAPLQPSAKFKDKQKIHGSIRIFTEGFLWRWPSFIKTKENLQTPDMTVTCQGKIEMEKLEDKWEIHLVKPQNLVKLWLN